MNYPPPTIKVKLSCGTTRIVPTRYNISLSNNNLYVVNFGLINPIAAKVGIVHNTLSESLLYEYVNYLINNFT